MKKKFFFGIIITFTSTLLYFTECDSALAMQTLLSSKSFSKNCTEFLNTWKPENVPSIRYRTVSAPPTLSLGRRSQINPRSLYLNRRLSAPEMVKDRLSRTLALRKENQRFQKISTQLDSGFLTLNLRSRIITQASSATSGNSDDTNNSQIRKLHFVIKGDKFQINKFSELLKQVSVTDALVLEKENDLYFRNLYLNIKNATEELRFLLESDQVWKDFFDSIEKGTLADLTLSSQGTTNRKPGDQLNIQYLKRLYPKAVPLMRIMVGESKQLQLDPVTLQFEIWDLEKYLSSLIESFNNRSSAQNFDNPTELRPLITEMETVEKLIQEKNDLLKTSQQKVVTIQIQKSGFFEKIKSSLKEAKNPVEIQFNKLTSFFISQIANSFEPVYFNQEIPNPVTYESKLFQYLLSNGENPQPIDTAYLESVLTYVNRLYADAIEQDELFTEDADILDALDSNWVVPEITINYIVQRYTDPAVVGHDSLLCGQKELLQKVLRTKPRDYPSGSPNKYKIQYLSLRGCLKLTHQALKAKAANKRYLLKKCRNQILQAQQRSVKMTSFIVTLLNELMKSKNVTSDELNLIACQLALFNPGHSGPRGIFQEINDKRLMAYLAIQTRDNNLFSEFDFSKFTDVKNAKDFASTFAKLCLDDPV